MILTNLFVAGFIGSPPMNLIHGEIESGKFFAKGCLINNVDKDSKKDVILGIRPEDMEIVQKRDFPPRSHTLFH